MGGDVNKAIEGVGDILGDGLKGLVKASSVGLIGIDEDGKFGAGKTGKFLYEGFKDVTGANAAEEANEDARSRFEEEKAKASNDVKEAKARTARDQIQASRSAGSVRGGVRGRDGTSGSRQSTLGTDEDDFLGL